MADRDWNGAEKVAALLLSLDREIAAKILVHMDEESITRIGGALADLDPEELTPQAILDLHEEFSGAVAHCARTPEVSVRKLDDLLIEALGKERAKQITEGIELRRRRERPFRMLEDLPERTLLTIIEGEHPQVVALVCSHLPPELVAIILKAKEEEERFDLIQRIGGLEITPIATLEEIADSLARKLEALPSKLQVADPSDRLRAVAKILTASEPSVERSVMDRIRESDSDVAEAIREQMFSFDDLAKLSRNDIQKVLTSVEMRQIAMALKACDPAVTEKILSGMSKRAVEMMTDEREALGPVPLSEVLNMQREIVNIVRDMVEQGEISLEGDSELVE